MPRDNMPTGARECHACHRYTMRDICFCGQSVSDLEAFAAKASAPPVVERARAKPRVKALNKTEQRWFDTIPATHFPAATVLPQALTLPLEGGGTYRVDFLCLHLSRSPTVIEVKGGFRGHGWEQGIERYRRARAQWGKVLTFEMWDWDSKEKKWEVER